MIIEPGSIRTLLPALIVIGALMLAEDAMSLPATVTVSTLPFATSFELPELIVIGLLAALIFEVA